MKPLFRWVGGKRRMLPELMKHLPKSYNTYIEPFAGAAALFCHLEPKGKAILCDANVDLMITYKVIRENPKELARRMSLMVVSEKNYYDVRSSIPSNEMDMAVRFLFLNRYGVNGMWRVNKDGNMNTPWDHRRSHVPPGSHDFVVGISKLSELFNPSMDLNAKMLIAGNYTNATTLAKTGDLIFMDPPYAPFTKSGHTGYTAGGFTWDDQIALRDEFVRLDKMGCHVVLTNSDIPEIRHLYRFYNLDSVSTKASVARSSGQGSYGELIISNLKKHELKTA